MLLGQPSNPCEHGKMDAKSVMMMMNDDRSPIIIDASENNNNNVELLKCRV